MEVLEVSEWYRIGEWKSKKKSLWEREIERDRWALFGCVCFVWFGFFLKRNRERHTMGGWGAWLRIWKRTRRVELKWIGEKALRSEFKYSIGHVRVMCVGKRYLFAGIFGIFLEPAGLAGWPALNGWYIGIVLDWIIGCI